jgi:hypothetical protein
MLMPNQVAFPGGKREPNETAEENAMRETLEEVGLDLSDKNKFLSLGRIGDRETSRVAKNNMVVSCFVFLQLTWMNEPVNLQHSEVHSCRWVSIGYFKNPEHRILKYPLSGLIGIYKTFAVFIAILKKFYGDSAHFPSIMLPGDDEHFPQGVEEKVVLDYQMWGLSLGMTSELLNNVAKFAGPFDHRMKTSVLWLVASIFSRAVEYRKYIVMFSIAAVGLYLSRGQFNKS